MDKLDYTNQKGLEEVLMGRRIVEAEMGDFDYPGRGWRDEADGRLVLDDGSVLYLIGHDGGCACSAGCYPLSAVAKVDNIITRVEIEADPGGDGYEGGYEGTYRIFVFADNEKLNVAEFAGTDGNGYYGTGFEIVVVRPSK
jgi:hypothetical protein